jgi:hypothetical protein
MDPSVVPKSHNRVGRNWELNLRGYENGAGHCPKDLSFFGIPHRSSIPAAEARR